MGPKLILIMYKSLSSRLLISLLFFLLRFGKYCMLCLCVQIIYRTALDHPHHCLYSILALSNASKDDKFSSSGHVSGKSSGRTSRLSRKGGSGRSVDEVSHQLPSLVVISMCTCMYSKYCSTVGVLLCKWRLFIIDTMPS